jgi:restriction system protein
MGRRRKRDDAAALAVLGGLVAFGLFVAVLRWADRHMAVVFVVLAIGVVVVSTAIAAVARTRRLAALRLAELERNVETADHLTGAQFEQWVARLMRHTGFTAVTVCGRAGDQGADITARAPDGRMTVVQCKRYARGNAVGAPEIYKFAGTARAIHAAQLAVMVTTSRFTQPAKRDAPRLRVLLIDRAALAAWAADHALPTPMNGS